MQHAREVLAANLRRAREARDLSLGELAKLSGVGKATLSRLESAQGNPTLETLYDLADVLGVSWSDLATSTTPAVSVTRAVDIPRIDGDAHAHLLTQVRDSPLVEVLRVDFDPTRVRQSKAHPSGVVEHVMLLEGSLVAGPLGHEVHLEPGDVLRFSADVPHSYAASGKRPAIAMLLMTYPRPTSMARPGERGGAAG